MALNENWKVFAESFRKPTFWQTAFDSFVKPSWLYRFEKFAGRQIDESRQLQKFEEKTAI